MSKEKTVIAVDSQMLETIQLCPRKWYYNFLRNITPLKTKDYLERGGFLHSILAEYIRNGKDMTLAIAKSWEEAAKLELDGAEIEVVHNNCADYAEYYANDGWEPIIINGTPLIERPAAKIMFENEDYIFLYQGVIDFGFCLRGLPLEEGLCIVDHKHSQRRGNISELSNQFVGYCWMMNTPRIIVNEIGFQKTLPPKERFHRHLFCYEESIVEEWVEESIKWIKQLVFHMNSDDWWMNRSSCNKFDGCWYSGLCTATPSFREAKIERDFRPKEIWDVGRRL